MEDKDIKKKVKGNLQLNGQTVVDKYEDEKTRKKKKFALSITGSDNKFAGTDKGKFVLFSKTEKERDEWIQVNRKIFSSLISYQNTNRHSKQSSTKTRKRT